MMGESKGVGLVLFEAGGLSASVMVVGLLGCGIDTWLGACPFLDVNLGLRQVYGRHAKGLQIVNETAR